MAKTYRAPWDYFNAREHAIMSSHEQIELGYRKGMEVARERVAQLRELDPSGWEQWYDDNIPDITSPGEIIRRVQARIDTLNSVMDQQADARLCNQFSCQL
jgi:hypothetical protein